MSKSIKTVYILPAILVVLAGCGVGFIYYKLQQPAIAVLNMEKVLYESSPGKAGREHLRIIDQRFQQGMNEMGETYRDASQQERQRALSAAEDRLVRQFQREERQVTDTVTAIVLQETEKWRKAHGVTVVLPGSMVLAVGQPAINCTDEVLAAVNNRTATFADFPVMNIIPPKTRSAEQPAPAGDPR